MCPLRDVYGIVAPIWEQATVLADILTGHRPMTRYRGSKLYTRLKVAGVEVASMGLTEPELDSDHVVQVIEERKQSYRKLIVRGGRLVGAVLVGDTESAAALVQQRSVEWSKKLALQRSLPTTMVMQELPQPRAASTTRSRPPRTTSSVRRTTRSASRPSTTRPSPTRTACISVGSSPRTRSTSTTC